MMSEIPSLAARTPGKMSYRSTYLIQPGVIIARGFHLVPWRDVRLVPCSMLAAGSQYPGSGMGGPLVVAAVEAVINTTWHYSGSAAAARAVVRWLPSRTPSPQLALETLQLPAQLGDYPSGSTPAPRRRSGQALVGLVAAWSALARADQAAASIPLVERCRTCRGFPCSFCQPFPLVTPICAVPSVVPSAVPSVVPHLCVQFVLLVPAAIVTPQPYADDLTIHDCLRCVSLY